MFRTLNICHVAPLRQSDQMRSILRFYQQTVAALCKSPSKLVSSGEHRFFCPNFPPLGTSRRREVSYSGHGVRFVTIRQCCHFVTSLSDFGNLSVFRQISAIGLMMSPIQSTSKRSDTHWWVPARQHFLDAKLPACRTFEKRHLCRVWSSCNQQRYVALLRHNQNLPPARSFKFLPR